MPKQPDTEIFHSNRQIEVSTKTVFITLVKTNLRNKMENDFLTDSLMLYIEKDIVSTFSLDSIVDDFEDLKEHRVPFSYMIVLKNNSVSCLLFLLVNDCILIY